MNAFLSHFYCEFNAKDVHFISIHWKLLKLIRILFIQISLQIMQNICEEHNVDCVE